MGMRIEAVSEREKDEWDSCVDGSSQTSFFHRYDALEVLARHFDATLHRIIGYVGEEPIGVFPVFGLDKGPFRLVASPPPSFEMHVGPALLNFEKLKQRKAEQRHREFVEASLDWIERELSPDYLQIGTTDRYTDVRPFLRREFDVDPSYTYVLDLGKDADDLLMQFSRDARNNIRNTDDEAYDIREGGRDEIRKLVSLVRRRHDEQDKEHYLDSEFVLDLYSSYGPEHVRPYVCSVDGHIVSGIIALEHGDTVYRWQGGPKPKVDVPVNDILDWYVIRESMQRNVDRYDLVGAMLPRLCDYKSKFSPNPVPLYIIERHSLATKAAVLAYGRLPTKYQILLSI
jgi:hypothetical protein